MNVNLKRRVMSKKGAVLMYVIMVLMLLAVVAMSMTLLAVNSYSSSVREADTQQAYYVARMIGNAIAEEHANSEMDIKEFLEAIYDHNLNKPTAVNGFDSSTEVRGSYEVELPDERTYRGSVAVNFANENRDLVYFTISATVNGATSIVRTVYSCLNDEEFQESTQDLLDMYQIYLTDPAGQSFEFAEETAGNPSVYLYNPLYVDDETIDDSLNEVFYIRKDISSILTITGGATIVNDTTGSVNLKSKITGYGPVTLKSIQATADTYVNGDLKMQDNSIGDAQRGGSVKNAYVRGDVTIDYNCGPQTSSTTIYSTGDISVGAAGTSTSVPLSKPATANNLYANGRVTIYKNTSINGWIKALGNVSIGQFESSAGNYSHFKNACVVKGDIYSAHNVYIKADAQVTGNIFAAGDVYVYGRVNGDIKANGKVYINGLGGISATAIASTPYSSWGTYINGNIECQGLECNNNYGAFLRGSVNMLKPGDVTIKNLHVSNAGGTARIIVKDGYTVNFESAGSNTNAGYLIDSLYYKTGVNYLDDYLDLDGYTVGNIWQTTVGAVKLKRGTLKGELAATTCELLDFATLSGSIIETTSVVNVKGGSNIAGEIKMKPSSFSGAPAITIHSGVVVSGKLSTNGKVVINSGNCTNATVLMYNEPTNDYKIASGTCSDCGASCGSAPHRLCLKNNIQTATLLLGDFNTCRVTRIKNFNLVGSDTKKDFTLSNDVDGNFAIDCSNANAKLTLANGVKVTGEIYTKATEIVCKGNNTAGSVYFAGSDRTYAVGFTSVGTVYCKNGSVVINSGCTVTGNVYAKKSIEVSGTVNQNISSGSSSSSAGLLKVTSTGLVKGNVQAAYINLASGDGTTKGVIKGNAYASYSTTSTSYTTIIDGVIEKDLVALNPVTIGSAGKVLGNNVKTGGETTINGSLGSSTNVILTTGQANINCTVKGTVYAVNPNGTATSYSSYPSPIYLKTVKGDVIVNGGELHLEGDVGTSSSPSRVYNSYGGSSTSGTKTTTIPEGTTIYGDVEVAGNLVCSGTITGAIKCGGTYGIDVNSFDWSTKDYSCSGDLNITLTGNQTFCGLNVGGTLTITAPSTASVYFSKDIVCGNLRLNSTSSIADSRYSSLTNANVTPYGSANSTSIFKVTSGKNIKIFSHGKAIICNLNTGTEGKATIYTKGAAIFKYCELYSHSYSSRKEHCGSSPSYYGSFWTGTGGSASTTYLINSNVHSNMHVLSGGLYMSYSGTDATENDSDVNGNQTMKHYINGNLTVNNKSIIRANERSRSFTSSVGSGNGSDFKCGKNGTIIEVTGDVSVGGGTGKSYIGSDDGYFSSQKMLDKSANDSREHAEYEIGLFAGGSVTTVANGGNISCSVFAKGALDNKGSLAMFGSSGSQPDGCGGIIYCSEKKGDGTFSPSWIGWYGFSSHSVFNGSGKKHREFLYHSNGTAESQIAGSDYWKASNLTQLGSQSAVKTSLSQGYTSLDSGTGIDTSGGNFTPCYTAPVTNNNYVVTVSELPELSINTTTPNLSLSNKGIRTAAQINLTIVQSSANAKQMSERINMDSYYMSGSKQVFYWNPKCLPHLWCSPRTTADGSITDLAAWLETNRSSSNNYQMTYSVKEVTKSVMGTLFSGLWNSNKVSSTQKMYSVDGVDWKLHKQDGTDMVLVKGVSVMDSIVGPIVSGILAPFGWIMDVLDWLPDFMTPSGLQNFIDSVNNAIDVIESAANPPATIISASFFESGIINASAMQNADYMESLDNYYIIINAALQTATNAVNGLVDFWNGATGWMNDADFLDVFPDVPTFDKVDYTIPEAYRVSDSRGPNPDKPMGGVTYTNYWGFQRGTATYGDCRLLFYACEFNSDGSPIENSVRDLHIVFPAGFNMSWFNDSDNSIQIIGKGRVFLYLEDNVRLSLNGMGGLSSAFESSFVNGLDWFNIGNNFIGYHYEYGSENSTADRYYVYDVFGNKVYNPEINSIRNQIMSGYTPSKQLRPQLYFIGCGRGIELDFQGYNVAAFIYMPSGESQAVDAGYADGTKFIRQYNAGIAKSEKVTAVTKNTVGQTVNFSDLTFYENRVLLDVNSKYHRNFIGAIVCDRLLLGVAKQNSSDALNKLTIFKCYSDMSDTYLLARVGSNGRVSTRGRLYKIGEFLDTPSSVNPIYLEWYFKGYKSV